MKNHVTIKIIIIIILLALYGAWLRNRSLREMEGSLKMDKEADDYFDKSDSTKTDSTFSN